jgi:hypothetical protein
VKAPSWLRPYTWTESWLPAALALCAHDPQPNICILEHRNRDDPRLPELEIEIDWAA